MSTSKRPRQRQSDARPTGSVHPAKMPRLSKADAPTGLRSLVDVSGKGRRTLDARISNGVKDKSNEHLNDSKAVVASRLQAEHDVDMKDADAQSSHSTGSEDEDEDEDEDDDEDQAERSLTNGVATNGAFKSKAASLTNGLNGEQDHEDAKEQDQSAASANQIPSFGDMLLAKYPGTIDVPSALTDQSKHATALVPADNSRNLQPPPATSLGTVLTQALKTNDKELLESCLQMNDMASIRSTIQRLQSPLVASLMLRLAERIHKRPGRAGILMRWIQWSLVAHGGYLASQPELVNRLRSLFQVVRERANSLQPLMMLKGKLDMLSAQVELRRDLRRPRPDRSAQDDDYDDIDGNDNVAFIEGQEESSDDDAEAAIAPITTKKSKRKSTAADEVVLVNGVSADEDSSDSDADDLGGLIDAEAVESEGDLSEISSEEEASDDEDEEDDGDDSVDDEDEAIDDDEPAEPPVSKKGGPIRRESLATKRPSGASLSSKRK